MLSTGQLVVDSALLSEMKFVLQLTPALFTGPSDSKSSINAIMMDEYIILVSSTLARYPAIYLLHIILCLVHA